MVVVGDDDGYDYNKGQIGVEFVEERTENFLVLETYFDE